MLQRGGIIMKLSHKKQPINKGNSQSTTGKCNLCCIFVIVLVSFASIAIFVIRNSDTIIKSSSSIDYVSKYVEVTKSKSLDSHMQLPFSQSFHSVSSKVENTPQSLRELPKATKRKRYAYAITITKDGFFQDGAAVLAYSIMKYSRNAKYDISFIAFVHPNVTTSRPGLRRLGFHVIEVPIPINVTAIQFDFLREKINKNGCCGSSELIKLTSYRLTQYDRVIHLDADVILLNPIDELFEKDYSLIYTTDPNMATFKKGIDKMPVQGGFIIIKPSIDDYRTIVKTLMTTEFRKYHGWNASNIGWYWGGMTVQGILPYYYHRIATPNRSLIVDRCYYNTMADTPECSTQTLQELKSAHFTVCQKPWGCFMNIDNRLCRELHRRWFELRTEAEAFYGITSSGGACSGGGGHKNYHVMTLDHAQFSTNKEVKQYYENVLPDDSLSRFDPLDESLYVGTQYD